MPKFIVTVREVWHTQVRVEAPTGEDAIERVAYDGPYGEGMEYLDDTSEYSHTMDKDTFTVEPDTESQEYTKCAHCWHFVQSNPAYAEGEPWAEYVHLDSGDKEHDHDAEPSGYTESLATWQKCFPELFKTYDDGLVGPNSEHFAAPDATALR